MKNTFLVFLLVIIFVISFSLTDNWSTSGNFNYNDGDPNGNIGVNYNNGEHSGGMSYSHDQNGQDSISGNYNYDSNDGDTHVDVHGSHNFDNGNTNGGISFSHEWADNILNILKNKHKRKKFKQMLKKRFSPKKYILYKNKLKELKHKLSDENWNLGGHANTNNGNFNGGLDLGYENGQHSGHAGIDTNGHDWSVNGGYDYHSEDGKHNLGIDGSYDSDGSSSIGGGYSYQNGNTEIGVSGNYDTDRGASAQAGITYHFSDNIWGNLDKKGKKQIAKKWIKHYVQKKLSDENHWKLGGHANSHNGDITGGMDLGYKNGHHSGHAGVNTNGHDWGVNGGYSYKKGNNEFGINGNYSPNGGSSASATWTHHFSDNVLDYLGKQQNKKKIKKWIKKYVRKTLSDAEIYDPYHIHDIHPGPKPKPFPHPFSDYWMPHPQPQPQPQPFPEPVYY